MIEIKATEQYFPVVLFFQMKVSEDNFLVGTICFRYFCSLSYLLIRVKDKKRCVISYHPF